MSVSNVDGNAFWVPWPSFRPEYHGKFQSVRQCVCVRACARVIACECVCVRVCVELIGMWYTYV